MIQDGIIKKKAAEFANRGSKDLPTNEEKVRQLKIRQRIDHYTDNNQMPIFRLN
jgi:hypothetical protein